MAATVTGTPVEITWASGASPASQNITIPADATAVYVFWSYYATSDNSGVSSITLAGSAPSQSFEYSTAGVRVSTGVAAWYNPTTGAGKALAVAWDNAPEEGATTAVVFVKDGDTTAWRDADGIAGGDADPVTVTLTTVSGDLVIKHDQTAGATAPSNTSGWTSILTGDNNAEAFRTATISASSTTQVCDSEDENFSTIVAISIPAGAGGGGGTTLGGRLSLLGVGI